MIKHKNLLGLDIGERRIGVARVNLEARLPAPIKTLANNTQLIENLQAIIKEWQIDGLVVGLPRNLSGQETAQSGYVRQFCDTNLKGLGMPIIWQDETLSTVAAADSVKDKKYNKVDVDAIAASIILTDYLNSGVNHEN